MAARAAEKHGLVLPDDPPPPPPPLQFKSTAELARAVARREGADVLPGNISLAAPRNDGTPGRASTAPGLNESSGPGSGSTGIGEAWGTVGGGDGNADITGERNEL